VIHKQRGFLSLLTGSGVLPYVLVAAVLAFAGLSLAVAYYKNSAARAQAEATLARDQRDRAIQAVKDAEEANQKLKALNEALDAAIVERDKRAKALEDARQKARREINELKTKLDAADQACLDRDLPPALLERLRDGPDHPDPR
jgi:hypothetical protein